ncbi:hypothetical protein GcC1_019027 [Golovinomyces cichoracearum]|uniref:Uncharacterized protein n=1 Tax=Golovinomyces cichoracearum TaxID=62708 RepID=A0A420J5G8_9PEZI|nr:hypothetical protein GcC1_019027 [Golovinomyces cichoracearum]
MKNDSQFLAEYEGNSDSEVDEEAMILDKIKLNIDDEQPIGEFLITANDDDDAETQHSTYHHHML